MDGRGIRQIYDLNKFEDFIVELKHEIYNKQTNAPIDMTKEITYSGTLMDNVMLAINNGVLEIIAMCQYCTKHKSCKFYSPLKDQLNKTILNQPIIDENDEDKAFQYKRVCDCLKARIADASSNKINFKLTKKTLDQHISEIRAEKHG
jgi:hypothetical protein